MGTQVIEPVIPVIKGTLSTESTMIGALSTDKGLTGALSKDTELSATISAQVENRYDGEYIFTPSKEDQVIDTDYRLLTQDLTIKGIPYYEVSNKDGITIIIGDY